MMVANGTASHNGHTTTGLQPPSWQQHEPPFLHSLKWQDPDTGIEHMTVIRASSAEALWQEVKTVVAMIRTVKTARPVPTLPTAGALAAAAAAHTPTEGCCAKHSVQMQRQQKDGRSWWSHKVNGQWCKGK
jgi:hypothetical protein